MHRSGYSGCFENINLQRLEHFLQKEICEEAERRLIHEYLYSWAIIDGRKERKSLGLVQGSPMSPVFSNVYMMEFDAYMELKYSFCRFADNINIYCNTEEEARKAFADAKYYLETKLGLKINQKKSGIYPAFWPRATRRSSGRCWTSAWSCASRPSCAGTMP